ncbi:MAG: hypothetical protein RLZZ165_1059 [Bacteroidota bacterium]
MKYIHHKIHRAAVCVDLASSVWKLPAWYSHPVRAISRSMKPMVHGALLGMSAEMLGKIAQATPPLTQSHDKDAGAVV